MPRPIDEKQLALVRGVIERAPDGCALADVAAALNPRPPRRNLQRWLATLVRQKRVVRVGHLKSTRYRLTAPGDSAVDPEAGLEPLPVRKGSAAHAIQILVARPLAERPAVEYRRAWLDAYEPNKTWYLSEEVRGQLRAAPGVAGGAARLNDPAWRKQFVEDVTYADLPLEGEHVNRLGLKLLFAGARNQEDERRVGKLAWRSDVRGREGRRRGGARCPHRARARTKPDGDVGLHRARLAAARRCGRKLRSHERGHGDGRPTESFR